ncbi:CocE/NonD family hydrolase [Peribacillus frigoritolerans]|nr:CocE/NonD family hydrolase [Peribacillus frigoritolerans]
MNHPIEDEIYWQNSSITGKFDRIQLPAFHLGGWYDCFIGPTLENYVEMNKVNGQLSNIQKLIVGPWSHGLFPRSRVNASLECTRLGIGLTLMKILPPFIFAGLITG